MMFYENAWAGASSQKTRIAEMMSSPLITIDPDAAVGDAMKLMVEKNIRRLFVVEKGKIAGRVTQTGLFERMLAVMTDLSSVAGQL